MEDLHDRAAGEGVDDRPGRRLDDNGRFLHLSPGEQLDLRSQLIAGDGKQGPVEGEFASLAPRATRLSVLRRLCITL